MKTLECSLRGDKRFSDRYALVIIKDETKSINDWYQNAKRNIIGQVPREGQNVDCMINPFNGHLLPAGCLNDFYTCLWIRYFTEHPDLLEYAKGFDNFNDMFRGKCVNCQADVIRECVKDFDGLKKKLITSDFYKECKGKVYFPEKDIFKKVLSDAMPKFIKDWSEGNIK